MIQQRYYQVEKPTEPFTDPYGVTLEVGKSVAYNYCSGVRLGVIKELSCKWYPIKTEANGKVWWHIRAKVIIAEKSGLTSIVKNINGIVIL